MEDLLNKMSDEYRKTLKDIRYLEAELRSVEQQLSEVENGADISLKEYNHLKNVSNRLNNQIKDKRSYSNGIFDMRELVMDIIYSRKENNDTTLHRS